MNLRKFHAVAIALIASAGLLNQARADTVYVGTPYGPSVTITGTTHSDLTNGAAGGDFQNSTLNGNALPWVYCVDVVHTVSPPATYTNALVTNDGKVNGAYVGGGTDTTIADKIAYVLLNHAGSAGTDRTLQGQVQAAVWNLEYGGTITSINGFTTATATGALVIAAANGYVSDANLHYTQGASAQLSWLTLNTNPNNYAQGLVTIASPEPSTFAIAALAGLGMVGYARKRRSR